MLSELKIATLKAQVAAYKGGNCCRGVGQESKERGTPIGKIASARTGKRLSTMGDRPEKSRNPSAPGSCRFPTTDSSGQVSIPLLRSSLRMHLPSASRKQAALPSRRAKLFSSASKRNSGSQEVQAAGRFTDREAVMPKQSAAQAYVETGHTRVGFYRHSQPDLYAKSSKLFLESQISLTSSASLALKYFGLPIEMKITATQLGAAEIRRTFSWVDIVVLLGVFGLAWTILHFGHGMVVHFDESQSPAISTDIRNIPYYAGRTVLRMWIAFGFSFLFTFSVGYAAAKNRIARSIILPALDILQSVPVLGFLSITVTGFMALFPGSLLGVECASIFAIFTGQVWNMTFGFYHSMVTIPNDLQEAATNFRLSPWQRFGTLEVPSSMHSLIWNSMMSFGGGWFFVAQSEAITVLNKNIKLPGLGSYMATAVEKGDNTAAVWAIVAMLAVILASDQLVWRPLLAWADKFKMELVESGQAPESWLYSFLRRAYHLSRGSKKKFCNPSRTLSFGLKKRQAR